MNEQLLLRLLLLAAATTACNHEQTSPPEPGAAVADQAAEPPRMEETPSALQPCRVNEEAACAALLRNPDIWDSVLSPYDPVPDANEILATACRGGHDEACRIVERTNTGPSDQVAARRFFAAMEELQRLGDQWVAQLATLSNLKCASGEQAEIAAAWGKNATGRDAALSSLDKTVEEVRAGVGPAADVWAVEREKFDRRIEAALTAALHCQLPPL